MALRDCSQFEACLTKGYGFIQPQGGGKDVFVHVSAVERAGLRGLNEGQVVEFDLVSNGGRTAAENEGSVIAPRRTVKRLLSAKEKPRLAPIRTNQREIAFLAAAGACAGEKVRCICIRNFNHKETVVDVRTKLRQPSSR